MQKQIALQSREDSELPALWIISGGRPDTLIDAAKLEKSSRWPKGIYESAPGYRCFLVVTSELPSTPDTLLLRLWSAGKTLKRAWAELKRLPPSAWEWKVVREALVALERNTLYADNPEGLAMIEEYRKVVEQWKNEVLAEGIQKGIQTGRQEGIQEGIQTGRQEGRQEGIQTGLHEAIETIYLSRFGPLSDALKARLHAIQEVKRLHVLISVFTVQTQTEIENLLMR